MRLNIYHTNDIHADFSFLSRVRAYLSDHREKSDLYFDSGDFLDLKNVLVQADRGRSALELLALCRPEAMAVGNNEIDLGSADLERLAQLPMLCANICRNDGTPVPGLKSHVILERCGKRFLVIGLAPYYGAGMIADKYNLFFEMGNLRTIDPVPAVTQILNENQGKYDFSILLSHSGHLVDRELAKRLPPMDLWLGGHSHTVVAEAGYSQSGKGEYLGRVALDIDEGNIRILDSAQIELPARRSPSFDARLKEAQAMADAILSQELPILRELDFDPFRESALTNFICDCLHREFGGDLALMHNGIALGPLRRPVSRKSLIELLPSKLNPTIYTLPGEKLLEAIRRSLDDAHIHQSGQGSGFRGTVLGCLGFSSNVTLHRDPFAVEIDGKPLDPRKDYTIVTDDYLQRGSGYPSLAVPDEEAKFDKRFIRDLVEEYLMNEAVFRAGEVKRER
ncbi:5'-nucleotidase C-terminal domain-containing protein [Pseudoflavonifractor sp. MSJ-30]|uniref:bifunctional metallophosphatase/5'-nucleotidase n=1 Tax=Pseudoflavonifractor sp. MSJ-30 TaxID=2841525 RepID=UPI001C0FCA77|nr:5'-nucleotidase C-terminal domain-containing protein [Pseudoflavonifractor sp. MSJ-30]